MAAEWVSGGGRGGKASAHSRAAGGERCEAGVGWAGRGCVVESRENARRAASPQRWWMTGLRVLNWAARVNGVKAEAVPSRLV